MSWNEEELLAVCRKFARMAPPSVVYKEPYLPYHPPEWNGVLVLAEAQQMGKKSAKYVAWLKSLSPEQRMRRLPCPWDMGVQPWDDGSIKLAIKAMHTDVDLDSVAVGNAVPWSCRTAERTNANPTERMKARAAEFWRELLVTWQPRIKVLLLLGNVAEEVLRGTGYADVTIELRLPSPTMVNRICGMFGRDDLLRRFPEVERAATALGMKPTLGKVFYACHAVSLGGRRFRELYEAA